MKINRDIIRENESKLESVRGTRKHEHTVRNWGNIDKICQGKAFFYGDEEVNIGLKKIDWSGGHIKHQEWPAQLNRFFHLIPLQQAYLETHDEKYAQIIRQYIEDWITYRNGEEVDALHHGDNTLNLSIRLGHSCGVGWGGIIPCVLNSPSFDDDFLTDVLSSMERQALFLTTHLSLHGNWRISQLDALVFMALRFPFLDHADQFLSIGCKGLQCAFSQQMHSDGLHEERTPGYHTWMTNVMARYYLLNDIFPEKIDVQINKDIVRKALEFCVYGDYSGVNDSGSKAFAEERFPNLELARGYLSKMGVENGDEWLPEDDKTFDDSGYVFSTTENQYLFFDASKWSGSHSHLSRLSIAYRANGRALVMDPGVLNYEISDPFMVYGKSTRAHSTLNINGYSQNNADAQLLADDSQTEIRLAYGRYDSSYVSGDFHWWWPLGHGHSIFGQHDRIVFWKKDEYVLALDHMLTEGDVSINNCWQLAPMDKWSMDQEQFTWNSENSDTNLFIKMLLVPDQTTMNCYEGQEEPIRGWIGHAGRKHLPAPLVEFSYPRNQHGNAFSAVLLSAYSGEQKPDFKVIDKQDGCNGNIQYLAVQTPSGYVDHISWAATMNCSIENAGPICSDAPFVWMRQDAAGKWIEAYLYNGTFIDFDNQTIQQKQIQQSRYIKF